MSYLMPSEFATKMVDSGAEKIFMSTKDTLIRAFMAGAILALAAVFAITVAMKSGSAILGAVLFPVGFIMLYLMKFDLLTGVFTLVPLAIIDKRRNSATEVTAENLIGGPIEGRIAIMFDDMISTAGSICGAARLVQAAGAREIHVAATHGIRSSGLFPSIAP